MKIIIVLITFSIIIKIPSVKGFIGELIVNILMGLCLNKKDYTVFKDLYIPRDNGTTSQVDHVVASKYGIFVIETKNYKGWIFGDENSKNWTQVIYKCKNKFLNPIIQNKGHIKSLKNYLEINDDIYYKSIVVFTLRAILKKINTTTPVIYSVLLVREIKKHNIAIISDNELKNICQKLSSIDKADFKLRKKYINEVNYKMNNKKCPRCGADLVKRNGKNGEFYGCSRYPKCRYTENI